jgi:TRL (tRNA-associated locus)-like protein
MRSFPFARLAVSAALSALSGGCVPGLLYTHIRTPLDLNYTKTPVQQGDSQTATSDVRAIKYYVSVSWHSNGIGDIAKEHGLKEVYYADYELLSVLFGIWRQDWVHVYGR